MNEFSKWRKLNKLERAIKDNKIDFTKHLIIFSKGTVWYRTPYSNNEPLTPSGGQSRFASQPFKFSFEKYAEARKEGNFILAGTGTTYYTEALSIGSREVNNEERRAWYKITLLENIEITDLDSICNSIGITKPYNTKKRHPVFHLFYGKKLKGLRYESAKNPSGYCFVIFNDWFPEFKDIVKAEKMISI